MRRVPADTNVVLAAAIFPRGVAAQAFWRVVTDDRLVLTQWVIDEAHDVVARKWRTRCCCGSQQGGGLVEYDA